MSRARPRPVLNKRRAARLAAVQALYQIEQGAGQAPDVVREFDHHRLSRLFEPIDTDKPSPEVDRQWFALLVEGAWAEHGRLDPALEASLAEGWTLDRCDALLRACLRAGAFELAQRSDVPTKVAINEYVDVAHLFLGGNEPAFVNAVLDRLARQLRPADAAP